MASNTESQTHYTFYTQPYLFFPRRIHAYLTFKPLPSDIKTTFHHLSFTQTGEMTSAPGKPAGSIPMLRYGEEADDLIRQSVAILTYLEEMHPRKGTHGEGWEVEDDMRGSTPMQRARVNEIISLTEEVGQAFGYWVMQSSALYSSKVPSQSPSAASMISTRMHALLSTLESYARKSVGEEGKWIAGTAGVTLADICLASVIEYARDMYGRDLIEGHEEVLGKWFERWEATEAGKPGGDKVPPEFFTVLGKKWAWEE